SERSQSANGEYRRQPHSAYLPRRAKLPKSEDFGSFKEKFKDYGLLFFFPSSFLLASSPFLSGMGPGPFCWKGPGLISEGGVVTLPTPGGVVGPVPLPRVGFDPDTGCAGSVFVAGPRVLVGGWIGGVLVPNGPALVVAGVTGAVGSFSEAARGLS